MNFTRVASTKGDIQIGKEPSHPERERGNGEQKTIPWETVGVFLFIALFSFPFMFFFIFLGARIQSIYIPFGVVCTAMERRNQENVRRRGINVTNYAGDPTTLVFLLLGKRSGENRSRPIIRANQLVWAFWASSKPINEPPPPRKKKKKEKKFPHGPHKVDACIMSFWILSPTLS